MPRIGEMFPSKWLQAEDLPGGKITVVTIAEVYAGEARQRRGEMPEAEWVMRLREMRKPMKLKVGNAKIIAGVLQCDDTDLWVDQQIGIFPSTYTSFGETKPCINVDINPVMRRPQLKGPGVDRTPIGEAAAKRFGEMLKQLGGTWDGFLAWLKIESSDALALAFGVAIPDIPKALAPSMKKYLDLIAKSEVVDGQTGEVLPVDDFKQPDMVPRDPAQIPGVSRGMPPASRPPANSVPDDDIPF